MTWFNTNGFIPHGHCYLWTPELLWTLVIAEAVITLAYFSIPFALLWFVRKRKDLQFNWIFYLFSLFIFTCGVTHLLGIWTIWFPDFWLDALAKAVTAIVSLIAAIMLWPLIPKALRLPSTKQLEELVSHLENEVHQRKLAEAELTRLKSESDQRFRILFESSPDALIFATTDGDFLDGNPSAVEMFECLNAAEFQTLNPGLVSPEYQLDGWRSDEKAKHMIRMAVENGSHFFEWELKKKDGTTFPADVLLTSLPIGEEAVILANVRDITKPKQVKQALLEAKQIAENSTRLKSEFLANMSHEIRTPMNAIVGISELVLNQEISPKVRFYLEKLQNASKSLISIINDILDFSKIESESMTVEKRRFNLDEILDNLSNLFVHSALNKGLTLNIDVSPDVPRQLLGDGLRIQQILSNLLSNAIKFTEKGTVGLRVNRTEETDADVVLEFVVADTGIGMSQEDRAKLFQPFGQANTSITRRFGGTGLGLAISKRLLKLMASDFEVVSSPGEGSRFSFSLAFDKCSNLETDDCAAEPAVKEAVAPNPSLCASGKNLCGVSALVVEDNETNQLIIKDMLELFGINVTMAGNGKDALALLDRSQFDVVLMDIHMPVMNGIEAAQRIRQQSRFYHLPIIALTADATLKEQENYRANGFNGLIIKPFRSEFLGATLSRVLNAQSINRTLGDQRLTFPAK
ncbi:ATP-binding protein [Methylomonas sp. MgM2]